MNKQLACKTAKAKSLIVQERCYVVEIDKEPDYRTCVVTDFDPYFDYECQAFNAEIIAVYYSGKEIDY